MYPEDNSNNMVTDNLMLKVINDVFSAGTKNDLEHYTSATHGVKKWVCYSDYCFDDKNKPNDVLCFTLVPYIDDLEKLSAYIKSIASADIKNTRKVGDDFVKFLKSYPLINFSFVLKQRKNIFGHNDDTVRSSLKATYEFIKQQYIEWTKNQPDQKDSYGLVIKKLNCVIRQIDSKKKTKQIVDMTLVTFLGAYVSSVIVQSHDPEIWGWFSDRDALNEVCDNFSIELFQYYLHGLSNGKNLQFAASRAGSQDKPFYEELVRIPDYVAGTLADYNLKDNLISKDKFGTMLRNYMAENTINNFVFKIQPTSEGLSCARLTLHRTESENDLASSN